MSLKNLSAQNKIPKILEKSLNNIKISKVYKRFETSLNIKDDFIVAISGGPDSLALSFLTKIYAIKNNLKVEYFLVNHKLRPESTKEANSIKRVLKNFSLNVQVLNWRGKKPLKNIQSIARKKRYELLLSKCKKLKINNLLLAHHQNDLFENFFIRLLRGSGLKGLISLDKKVKIGKVNIIRPLLSTNKKDLIFISKHVFNFYVNDPTNNDEKFQRIRVRKLLVELKKDGYDEKKFINTINNLKHSDNVISFYVKKNIEENSHFFLKKKKNLILKSEFFNQPHEVIFRSLSNLIKIVGKKYYPARGKKLEKLIKEIKKKSLFKTTLGGCIIEKVSQSVIISKEH